MKQARRISLGLVILSAALSITCVAVFRPKLLLIPEALAAAWMLGAAFEDTCDDA